MIYNEYVRKRRLMSLKEVLNSNGYQSLDQFDNLYKSKDTSILYSDGEIETVIFNHLNELPSSKLIRNQKLEESIVDWPTKYHFTWERVNILKPIDFNINDKVYNKKDE